MEFMLRRMKWTFRTPEGRRVGPAVIQENVDAPRNKQGLELADPLTRNRSRAKNEVR